MTLKTIQRNSPSNIVTSRIRSRPPIPSIPTNPLQWSLSSTNAHNTQESLNPLIQKPQITFTTTPILFPSHNFSIPTQIIKIQETLVFPIKINPYNNSSTTQIPPKKHMHRKAPQNKIPNNAFIYSTSNSSLKSNLSQLFCFEFRTKQIFRWLDLTNCLRMISQWSRKSSPLSKVDQSMPSNRSARVRISNDASYTFICSRFSELHHCSTRFNLTLNHNAYVS